MSSLIQPSQSAFVEGRQIMDSILIANEVIDSMKKSTKGGLILKLDFEKAFDSVDWNFLISIMKLMGFGQRWISWIQTCISSAFVFVFVNGSPSSPILMQMGLRQSDPLSPFVYYGG